MLLTVNKEHFQMTFMWDIPFVLYRIIKYKLYFITRNTSLHLHQASVIFEDAFSAQAVLEVVFMRVRLGNFHAECLKLEQSISNGHYSREAF